jgi:hypothetical protein
LTWYQLYRGSISDNDIFEKVSGFTRIKIQNGSRERTPESKVYVTNFKVQQKGRHHGLKDIFVVRHTQFLKI